MAKQILIPHEGPGKKFVGAILEGLGIENICTGLDIRIRIDEPIQITIHTLAQVDPDAEVDVTTLASVCREYANAK